MSPNQHRIRIRVFIHRRLQAIRQILLKRRILNHRNPQRIMVPQIPRLLEPPPKPLDLLNIINLKDVRLRRPALLQQQRDQHRPLRVRVDAAPGVALVERRQEERGTLRWLEGGRGAQVDALLGVGLRLQGQHVDVFGLHELFLHAGGSEVDEVTGGVVRYVWVEVCAMKGDSPLADAGSPAGSCDPAQVPELCAELGDEVGGVLGVIRLHEMVVAGVLGRL